MVWIPREQFEEEIKTLKKSISKYGRLFYPPTNNFNSNSVNTRSCYFQKQHELKHETRLGVHLDYSKEDSFLKSVTVELLFSKTQRKIINKWMLAFRYMYNETLRVIKKRYYNGQKTIINFRTLRNSIVKSIKQYTIKKFTIKIGNKNIKPNAHMLDDAIKLVCASYKSAFSNLRNGHITHFRIRYWRQKKSKLMIKLEKTCFNNNTICKNIFGSLVKIKHNYGGHINLSNITHDCTIQWNRKNNKYYLFIPQDLNTIVDNNTHNYVGIDPGCRTFLTCYSKTHINEFTINKKKYRRLFNLIDRMDNSDKPSRIKKRWRIKRYEKLKNLTNETHWKIINNLVQDHRYIFIGNMSVKSIISNKNSVLSDMEKRICNQMAYYKFGQRLLYKCMTKKKCGRIIHEAYTTKMCCKCKTIKEDLGGNSKYYCEVCDRTIMRDLNGAINIALKGVYKLERE